MKRKLVISLLVAILLTATWALAEVKLPRIYSDHMVIQRHKPFLIYGWADPGEEVTIELAGHEEKVIADKNGLLRAKIPALKTGGPHTLKIKGKNTLEIKDILIGEVWVCSGQSNMERWLVKVQNGPNEVKKANYPEIRLLQLPHHFSGLRETDIHAEWKVCNPKTVNLFSAIAYYFGRELNKELRIPIGLIDTTWGGTRIEPWIPLEGFEKEPELKDLAERTSKEHAQYKVEITRQVKELKPWVEQAQKAIDKGLPLPLKPKEPKFSQYNWSSIFNGMIAPLLPLKIRGVLWYQGEHNMFNRDTKYDLKMAALIKGWRQLWGQRDFPFYFVQLAPYYYRNYPTEMLPLFWELQNNVTLIPNTGMVVINDIGNLKDIHPKNKHDVAHRLAQLALKKTYGKKIPVYCGPFYETMKIEGGKIRVDFRHTGSGLASRDGKPLSCFFIAGADKKFVEGKAVIKGESVIVSSPKVKKPAAVRFAWNRDALPNLMNKEGFPANSFRTDNWEVKVK